MICDYDSIEFIKIEVICLKEMIFRKVFFVYLIDVLKVKMDGMSYILLYLYLCKILFREVIRVLKKVDSINNFMFY